MSAKNCQKDKFASASRRRSSPEPEGSPQVKSIHFNALLDFFASLANANLSFFKLIQTFLSEPDSRDIILDHLTGLGEIKSRIAGVNFGCITLITHINQEIRFPACAGEKCLIDGVIIKS